MAFINFLNPKKRLKPVGFDYKPRFYDERKEEILERHKAAADLQGDNPEALKARIKRNMHRQTSSLNTKHIRRQQMAQSSFRFIIIIAVLLLLGFIAIEVYLPRFIHYFE